MYLITIGAPIAVSSWSSFLTHIPSDVRGDLDLEKMFATIPVKEFMVMPITCQKAILVNMFDESDIVDHILMLTSSCQVHHHFRYTVACTYHLILFFA